MLEVSESQKTVDAVLVPYLEAQDGYEAEEQLANLLDGHATPVISGIIRRKLRASLRNNDGSVDNQNALEVRGDVQVQLLHELNILRTQPAGKVIGNFRSYVAVVTYHACYEHLRQKYPKRHSLKNKLRYLLTHQAEFALWENERRELIAGYAPAGQSEATRNDDLWSALREEPVEWAALTWPARPPSSITSPELLRGLFDAVRGPVELDDLVNVCAAVWDVQDVREESNDETTEQYGDRLPDQHLSVAAKIEQEEYLQRLWAEVGQLPVRQRSAILLNLRDAQGRSMIALLPLTGVASIRQIAETLEIPPLELAEMWPRLPLDDATIAARLALTRQQVINLRKAGRERLTRRMRQFI